MRKYKKTGGVPPVFLTALLPKLQGVRDTPLMQIRLAVWSVERI